MKKWLFIVTCFFVLTHVAHALPKAIPNACMDEEIVADEMDTKNISIVKQMFSEFAEKLDMSKFDVYYTKDFVLESNGERYDYQQYKDLEKGIYEKLKSLKVTKYDDIFSDKAKVAARMSIRLVHKDGKTNDFKVILIALIKNNKIAKISEITYPSWSDKLPNIKK